LRAAAHNRSLEAEARAILQAAVQQTLGMGSTLAAIGRAAGGGVELNVARDRTATDAASFD
jgi:plasmid stability protein